ncbi:hypothetical protein JXM83_02845 [Candidatus Woesearchaeota archaeon]|nr:hypothetical protein [Candidatus Woesearchaeota archaeon]
MKPLPSSLFLLGILGFVVSAYLTSAEFLDASWGFAFCLTFVIIFISSVISMTPSEKDLEINLKK